MLHVCYSGIMYAACVQMCYSIVSTYTAKDIIIIIINIKIKYLASLYVCIYCPLFHLLATLLILLL